MPATWAGTSAFPGDDDVLPVRPTGLCCIRRRPPERTRGDGHRTRSDSDCGKRASADDAQGRTSYGADLEHGMIPGVRHLREACAHDATGDFAVPGDNGSPLVDWDLDGVEGIGSAFVAQFAPTATDQMTWGTSVRMMAAMDRTQART